MLLMFSLALKEIDFTTGHMSSFGQGTSQIFQGLQNGHGQLFASRGDTSPFCWFPWFHTESRVYLERAMWEPTHPTSHELSRGNQ